MAMSVQSNTSCSQPVRKFALYVDQRLIDDAWNFAKGNATALRAIGIKTSKLFGTVPPDREMILSSLKNKNKAQTAAESLSREELENRLKTDVFLRSFDVTWGMEAISMDDEYKLLIADFIAEAMVAMDCLGMIPWYVRAVSSVLKNDAVFYVPAVCPPGTFKVRQVRGAGGFDIMYALEKVLDDNPSIEDKQGPYTLSRDDVKNISKQARAVTGVTKPRKPKFSIGNQARDATNTKESKRRYGVYVFEQPSIDGIPVSRALACLQSAQIATTMSNLSIPAASIAAQPPLVTQRVSTSSSSKNAMSPVGSLLNKGDVAKMNHMSVMQRAALNREYLRQNLAVQAAEQERAMEAQNGYTSVFNATTRRFDTVRIRSQFRDGFVVADDYQVTNQQMPTQPPRVEARQCELEDVSKAFDIPLPFLTGEAGNLTANAELSKKELSETIAVQASKLAIATAYILDFINRKFDDAELNVNLAELMQKPETPPERIARLKAELANTKRYTVSFPRALPTSEAIMNLSTQGVIARPVQAALMLAAEGLPGEYAQLADYPNPYERPPEPEKPGAKRPSDSASSKPKKAAAHEK